MSPKTSFPERLRSALKASGLSQRKVEAKAGLNPGHISNLLSRPSEGVTAETSRKLALALGVGFTWLSTGEGEMTPPPPPVGAPGDPTWLDTTLDAVFDGARHKPSDAQAVRQLFHPEMLAPGTSAADVVKAWLDAAARIRGRGGRPSAEAILADLAGRVVELERHRPPSQGRAKAV